MAGTRKIAAILLGILLAFCLSIVRAGTEGERELVMPRWGVPGPPQYGGAPITNIPHFRGWPGPSSRCTIRPRRQRHAPAELFAKDAKGRDPSVRLIVGRNQMPRCSFGRGFIHHVLDRRFILRPAGAIAEVLVGQFPALDRVDEPIAEAPQLFRRG